MGDKGYQDRTEPATPKRRQKARAEGQVAKSRELNTALVLLTGFGALTIWGTSMYQQITNMFQHWFTQVGTTHLNPAEVHKIFSQITLTSAYMLAPIMLSLCLVAILSNYLQVGALFSLKSIRFNFSKLNPLNGIKRLFSLNCLVELFKSLLKVTIIGSIAYITLKTELIQLFPLLDKEVTQILSFMFRVAGTLFWRVCLGLIVLAILDYSYQKYQYEKNLRMTKQEVKDEFRQAEGDPKVKSRLRSLMRQLGKKRMMAQVPNADVVVTNPTHYAVALQYDSEKMIAPQVVAKGQGYLALKIIALAQTSGVPRIEKPDLARALYRLVKVGEYIPSTLYRAVAEILAHIYRLRARATKI